MAAIPPRFAWSWGAHPRQLVVSLLRRLREDSLLRNSLFIMAATVVNSAMGGIFWVVAARAYAPQAVGLAAALVSVWGLASVLTCTGIGSSLVQLLPSRANGRAWSTTVNAAFGGTILVGLCAGIVAVAILEISSNRFDILRENPAFLLVFVLAVPIGAISSMQDALCVAERAGEKMFLQNVVGAVSKNLFAIAFVPTAWISAFKIFGAVGAAAGCSVVVAVFLMLRLGREYQFVIRGVAAEARAMLGTVLGHHLINAAAMAPALLLPTLVTIRLSPTDNAYFYTTWMVGGVFLIISPAVSSALFAEGSYRVQRLRDRTWASAKIITALLSPLILVTLLGAPWILGVFGAAYARHGVGLLDVMVIAAIPDAITNIYVSTLRVRKRLREAAVLNLGMGGLAVLLAWLLLPTMGIIGAGTAWLVSQIVGSIVVAVQLFRERIHDQMHAPRPRSLAAFPDPLEKGRTR